MRRFLLALAVLSFSYTSSWAEESSPVLVVLSIDGLSADQLEKQRPKTFESWMKEGVYTRMSPVFPSLTFPNHATFATGCAPYEHGIVANRFVDRSRAEFSYEDDPSWLLCEPIWVAAEKENIKTAVYHWPFSYGAWSGVAASFHEKSFNSKVSDRKILKRILSWIEMPKSKQPRFILSYLKGPDHLGHEEGPFHNRTLQRIEQLDRDLSLLKPAIDSGKIELFLISDHGMAEVFKPIAIEKEIKKMQLGVYSVLSSAVGFLYFWKPPKEDELRKKFAAFQEVELFSPEQILQKFGGYHERMGDYLIFTQPPHFFSTKYHLKTKGAHGYDSRLPQMQGIALFVGQSIPSQAKLNAIEALDIAPTIAQWLGMKNFSKGQERSLRKRLLKGEGKK